MCASTQISETAHTHKFAAHRHIVVDHKITIIRKTINFSGTKTALIQAEDHSFWSSRNFGHKDRSISGWKPFFLCLDLIWDTKTALILGEFSKKVCTRQNFCAKRPQKIRGNNGQIDIWNILKRRIQKAIPLYKKPSKIAASRPVSSFRKNNRKKKPS